MNIIIDDNHGLIEAARFEVTNNLTASAHIETKEKWAISTSYGSCTHPQETYIEFYYDNNTLDDLAENDYGSPRYHAAGVKFFAETEEERVILGRLHFTMHDKYSQWFLFVDSILL